MRIPLTNLKAQHGAIADEIRGAVHEVLDAQEFVLGPRVARFEEEVAAFLGVEAAIGVSSGTDALLLALLDAGIGPGDDVITTAFTFIATVETIVRVGARPVFVDVDPDTLCLDPEKLHAAITPRTRAIVVVHLFGQAADLDTIRDFSRQHELVLVEDAAQSFGGRLSERALGSLGDYGAFSFFPAKILGAAGDGGLVVTSAEKAERVRSLRNHGVVGRDRFERVGGNFRLDALQAAILSVKLRHANDYLVRRRRSAELYLARFGERAKSSAQWSERLRLPSPRNETAAWNYFVIRTPERDALSRALAEAGIASVAYYRTPLHLQPCFAGLGYAAGSLPETERASRDNLALPLCSELGAEAIEEIVSRVATFMEEVVP